MTVHESVVEAIAAARLNPPIEPSTCSGRSVKEVWRQHNDGLATRLH